MGYGQFEKVSSKRYVSQMENPKMSLYKNALVRKFMFRKFKTTFKIECNTWQILLYCTGFAQKNKIFISFLNLCFAKQRFLLKDAKGRKVFSIREDYYTKELDDNNTIVCPRNYRS